MRTFWWVIVVGVAARVAMVVFDPAPDGLTRLEPSVIADNLNAGRGFTFPQYGTMYHALKEPLYITLLAWLVRWTGEHQLVLLVFQGCFGIAAALGVAWIARFLLDDPRKATVAGVIAAVNPFLVYYDTHFIHPLSMDSVFFIAATGANLVAVSRVTTLRPTLVAGLVTGAALWQRVTVLATGVGSWSAAVWLARTGSRRRVMQRAAVWLCVAGVVISPWFVRNYRFFGRLVFTTDAAHILWLGNNPWSNGTYSDLEGQRVFYRADPVFQDQMSGASELEQSDLFLGAVRQFIVEHPVQCGSLVLRKLWAFVWFSPNAGLIYTPWQRLLYRVAYVVLLMLGIAGLIRCWRRTDREHHRQVAVLLAAVAGLALVHALTAVNLKHRVPLELVLAVFAAESVGMGLAYVRSQWDRASRKLLVETPR